MSEIIELLNKKGWSYKTSGSQAILEECPYCGKKRHFYINRELGGFDCKVCMESGGLQKLKRDFDKDFVSTEYRKPVKPIKIEPPKIPERNYLSVVRKINNNVTARAGVVFKPEQVGFIYCDPEGKSFAVKYRSTKEKKFWIEPKCVIEFPYQIHTLSSESDYVILTEGEIDCLSWKSYGYSNAIGVPGAGTFKGSWIDLIKGYKRVYFSFDSDKAGETGAKKIIEKLQDDFEIYSISLPKKDINDCLQQGVTTPEIVKCFEGAAKHRHLDIVHLSEIEMKAPSQEDFGFKTGIDGLDQLTQWRMSELTVFTAHTKAGKTSFLLNLAMEQAKRERPILIGSFEITLEVVKKKMFSMLMQESFYKCKDEKKIADYEKLIKAIPVYFINQYGAIDEKRLVAAMRYAVKYLDVKFILLDHLSYMHKFSSSNMTYEIGKCMRNMKALANELGVHIWLIAHPSKTESEDDITEFALRGSAEIAQICDNLIILRADKENQETSVDLRLSRSELANAGKIILQFDTDKQTYKYKCTGDENEAVYGNKKTGRTWSGKKQK